MLVYPMDFRRNLGTGDWERVGNRYREPCTWHLAPGTWHLALGIGGGERGEEGTVPNGVKGTGNFAPGTWHLEPGTGDWGRGEGRGGNYAQWGKGNWELCTWNLEHGTWCLFRINNLPMGQTSQPCSFHAIDCHQPREQVIRIFLQTLHLKPIPTGEIPTHLLLQL